MAELTDRALSAVQGTNLEPKMVVVIEGFGPLLTTTSVKEIVRIGDDLVIGEFVIGGFKAIKNQEELISFERTTTKIDQKLEPDKSRVGTISSMLIAMVDKDQKISRLISPGQELNDILFKKAKVYLGFGDSTDFPSDYIAIFNGFIDDISSGPGFIDLNISSTDQKQAQSIFVKTDTTVLDDIDNAQTTIEVDDASQLFVVPSSPFYGGVDPTVQTYIRINDEIIQYTGKAAGIGPNGGTVLTGCVRGQQGTAPAAHLQDDSVTSLFILEDNTINLARKIMLSDASQSVDVELIPTDVNVKSPTERVENAFIFSAVDVGSLYNVQVGDYVKSSGFANAGNDLGSFTEIIDIGSLSDGSSYIQVDATLTDEVDATGTIEITSQYNTLGTGMGMKNDEVDLEKLEFVRSTFLSGANVKFELTNTEKNGKEFISKQLYLPFGCYELLRDAKSSLGIHTAPLPGENIQQIDATNIKDPGKIVLKRSLGKNFYNHIIYQYDKQFDESRYLKGYVRQNADSLNRVKAGVRALNIESDGLRSFLGGDILAENASARLLNRYAFGAEYFRRIKVHFSKGVQIDIGSNVIFDPTGLHITNTSDGTRVSQTKLYECTNKSIDIKTGNIEIELTNTNYEGAGRYGLISPASIIKTGVSGTEFVIQSSFESKYGDNEFRKWEKYQGIPGKELAILVRSEDSTTRFAEAKISEIQGNTIVLQSDLGFTPQAGDIMELATFDFPHEDNITLVFGFISENNGDDFFDGSPSYVMF